MKKETIISALLLVSPVSQLNAQDLSEARAVVLQQKQELVEMQFISKATKVSQFWEQDEQGEWGPMNLRHHIRIAFVKTDGGYSYDGQGDLEYEAIIEAVTAEGKVLNDFYGTHYVKRLDENTFKLFDCDSTATCSDDTQNIVFHIFDTPKGKLMKFKQSSKNGSMHVSFSKEYLQVL